MLDYFLALRADGEHVNLKIRSIAALCAASVAYNPTLQHIGRTRKTACWLFMILKLVHRKGFFPVNLRDVHQMFEGKMAFHITVPNLTPTKNAGCQAH